MPAKPAEQTPPSPPVAWRFCWAGVPLALFNCCRAARPWRRANLRMSAYAA
ncbi:hypothetical protein MJ575_11100 [Klebsiella pneumoniae]|nr:hypothetical protein MJ575_11100 [Klebsiella pneumoniae]